MSMRHSHHRRRHYMCFTFDACGRIIHCNVDAERWLETHRIGSSRLSKAGVIGRTPWEIWGATAAEFHHGVSQCLMDGCICMVEQFGVLFKLYPSAPDIDGPWGVAAVSVPSPDSPQQQGSTLANSGIPAHRLPQHGVSQQLQQSSFGTSPHGTPQDCTGSPGQLHQLGSSPFRQVLPGEEGSPHFPEDGMSRFTVNSKSSSQNGDHTAALVDGVRMIVEETRMMVKEALAAMAETKSRVEQRDATLSQQSTVTSPVTSPSSQRGVAGNDDDNLRAVLVAQLREAEAAEAKAVPPQPHDSVVDENGNLREDWKMPTGATEGVVQDSVVDENGNLREDWKMPTVVGNKIVAQDEIISSSPQNTPAAARR